MRIRDIRHFRTFYKKDVRKIEGNNRDENFIGSSVSIGGETKFGFFDIYHGHKPEEDGIEGFLRGFLDMAQDSQAVYEFLQNAVDSNSTTFEMHYDDNYFLAFNNGSQFDFNGISSILNVGISTKSKDSSSIGKFGIGFKLIHRLVGKESGLEELRNLSGPILFSWGRYSELTELKNFSEKNKIITTKDTYTKSTLNKFESTKDLPWLFKILLTNFPCQPEENIKDLEYKEKSNSFNKLEVIELAKWAKNKITKNETNHRLNNGSLFFLKLGEGKSNSLSNTKIEKGIEFSLSILNKIAKSQNKNGVSEVRINDTPFSAKKLYFEEFIIEFDSEEFNRVNPQRRGDNDTSDLQIIIGFMDYRLALQEIKASPNFYLFFPLSEEVHNVSFIIHSTGFYNASQRTNLQGNENSKNGINETLLLIATEKIKQKLFEYSANERFRKRFLKIYSNLLLSNKATENHRNWVDNCLILPIFEVIKSRIPTQKGYSNTQENVKVKDTDLNISLSDFGCSEIEWFVWNEKEDKVLIDEVRKPEKLHLKKWNIIDMLRYAIKHGKINTVNEWIKQADRDTYSTFINEIDENICERDLSDISKIDFIKFYNGDYYSLDKLFLDYNLILTYEKVSKIKCELRSLGFITSNLNISEFTRLFGLISSKINEEELFKKIAEKCKQNHLNVIEKEKLFLSVSDFKGVGPDKLQSLELFKDTDGKIHPLSRMLPGTLQVPNWLSSFKIDLKEYFAKLDKYLVKESEIYDSIIYDNWDSITQRESTSIEGFYIQVTDYFQQNSDNRTLDKLDCIHTKSGFKKIEQIFFNPNLDIKGFEALQDAIFKIAEKPTPNKSIFRFLVEEKSPFRISKNDDISSLIDGTCELLLSELQAVLKFAKKNKEKLFLTVHIQKKDEDLFLLTKHSQSAYQYYSNHKDVIGLLSNQEKFKLLPTEFDVTEFMSLGILSEKELNLKILETLGFEKALLPVIEESDNDVKTAYLSKLDALLLEKGKAYNKDSFEHRCLELAINCYGDKFQEIFSAKILVEGKFRIKDFAVSNEIKFENTKLFLSTVLPFYGGKSDIITAIINQFKDFNKSELKSRVFPISYKNKHEVCSELQAEYQVLQNIEQFEFLIYYSKETNKNHFTSFDLRELQELDILSFCFRKKITDVNKYEIFEFKDKIYPSEFALESEVLPNWVLSWVSDDNKQEEKLEFLKQLGLHIENSDVLNVRNFFKTSQSEDIQKDIVGLSESLLVNTLKWLHVNCYEFDNLDEKRLNALKKVYNRINHYSKEIPLLYINEISDIKTNYSLDVSEAKKYYFETSQIEDEQNVLVALKSKEFKLISLDFIKKWEEEIKDLSEIKIERLLDDEVLNENCEPWDNEAYKEWKKESNHKILIYKGEKLPYRNFFLEKEISAYTEGLSIKRGNDVFVCESVLYDIRKHLSEHLPPEELLSFYKSENNTSEIVQTLQNRLAQLEEKIKQLQKKSDWKESDTFQDDFDQVITGKEYNLITGYKAEAFVYEQLKEKGYKNLLWTNKSGTETNQKIKSKSGATYFIDEKFEAYDLTFTDKNEKLCYIQVKATTTSIDIADNIKMIITKGEWSFLQKQEYKEFYYMARVFNTRNYPTMKFFKMEFITGT
ncbi:MAG: hypothetical protein ACJAWV_000334 [Flammeovirgaceae bacterium]|jgi:hypothetical protein